MWPLRALQSSSETPSHPTHQPALSLGHSATSESWGICSVPDTMLGVGVRFEADPEGLGVTTLSDNGGGRVGKCRLRGSSRRGVWPTPEAVTYSLNKHSSRPSLSGSVVEH